MNARPATAFVPLAAALLLGGCSTVRGWFHLDEEAAPASAAATGPAVVSGASRPEPRRDAKPLASEAIRLEIRAVEADTVSGKISLKDSRKRLPKLREDLDDALRAEARANAATAGRPVSAVERDQALGARLDAIVQRLDSIERRLDAVERR